MKTESKETDIKNRPCYCFDDIIGNMDRDNYFLMMFY